jgi:hypothetical protein
LALKIVGVAVLAEVVAALTHAHYSILLIIAYVAEKREWRLFLSGEAIKVKQGLWVIVILKIAVAQLFLIPEMFQ